MILFRSYSLEFKFLKPWFLMQKTIFIIWILKINFYFVNNPCDN